MSADLKSYYLLDPEVIYLNHGSLGACPRPVFEVYQDWQLRLERNPVDFYNRLARPALVEARAALAAYLGITADDVVYFTNPTTALNMVARSVHLQPGDEVLASDHEYGSLNRTWQYYCRRAGAEYINQSIPLPLTTTEDFVETFWAGVSPRTRLIFLSHITSPTALIFPVAEICARARQSGILTVIDGAHAPGQIALDLPAIGPDFYAGACHKWLSAPKGSGFLYARREVQDWLDPLVISWGYESEFPGSSRFIDYHEMQGTRDLAAFLAVPAAIAFQAENDWPAVRQRCHTLASQTRARLNALTGFPAVAPEERFGQMFTALLPDELDPAVLREQLAEDKKIVVPVGRWNGKTFIRVSFQAYNCPADADALLSALSYYLR